VHGLAREDAQDQEDQCSRRQAVVSRHRITIPRFDHDLTKEFRVAPYSIEVAGGLNRRLAGEACGCDSKLFLCLRYTQRMAKQRTGNLAKLERQLAALDQKRHTVIVNIRAIAAGLGAGISHFVEAEKKELAPVGKAVKRRFSKAARAKLAAAAKARWAAAKKAGKKKLG
jgi:hypothetical protein